MLEKFRDGCLAVGVCLLLYGVVTDFSKIPRYLENSSNVNKNLKRISKLEKECSYISNFDENISSKFFSKYLGHEVSRRKTEIRSLEREVSSDEYEIWESFYESLTYAGLGIGLVFGGAILDRLSYTKV